MEEEALKVTGIRSEIAAFAKCEIGGDTLVVPMSDTHDPKALARKIQAMPGAAGRVVTWKRVEHQVATITSFAKVAIADHPGLNEAGYVLGDHAISATGVAPPLIPYTAITPTGGSRGQLQTWREEVAASIASEPIVALLAGAALAAFITDVIQPPRGLILELTGGPATGKTTAAMTAASIVGLPSIVTIPFGKLLEDPVRVVTAHADRPIFVGDPGPTMAGERGKAHRALRDAIITVSDGVRLPSGRPVQPVTIIESRRPLVEWVDADSDTGALLDDRIITIPLIGRPDGVFENVPEDYPSTSAYAEALRAAASANYGTAAPHFIQALLDARRADGPALRASLLAAMAEFRTHCQFDPNVGTEVRDVDAFALFHAGMSFASQHGVLPRGNYGPRVRRCYRLHRSTKSVTLFGRAALEALINHPDALGFEQDEEPDADIVATAGLIILPDENTTIIRIRVSAIKQYIPRWRGKVVPPDLKPFLTQSNDRTAVYRRHFGQRDRFYEFVLPDAA